MAREYGIITLSIQGKLRSVCRCTNRKGRLPVLNIHVRPDHPGVRYGILHKDIRTAGVRNRLGRIDNAAAGTTRQSSGARQAAQPKTGTVTFRAVSLKNR